MYYTTDTHALLWYLMDSKKLSLKARKCFDESDNGEATIIVPAMVLIECIDVIDKKKVNINFEEIILKMTQASNFMLSEINWSLIIEVNKLKTLKDLHDRIIIATAQIFNTPLITKDKTIQEYYSKTIW